MSFNTNNKYKIMLIGNSGTGKSDILSKIGDKMCEKNKIPDTDINFVIKNIRVDNENIELKIFDVTLLETFTNFNRVPAIFYRGHNGIILMYDITNIKSFYDLKNWLFEIGLYAPENVNIILVGNKNDLDKERKISYEDGKKFANLNDISFIETSAKNGTNINELLLTISKEIKEKIKNDIMKYEQNSAAPVKIQYRNYCSHNKYSSCW